jgi:hypothetical protein
LKTRNRRKDTPNHEPNNDLTTRPHRRRADLQGQRRNERHCRRSRSRPAAQHACRIAGQAARTDTTHADCNSPRTFRTPYMPRLRPTVRADGRQAGQVRYVSGETVAGHTGDLESESVPQGETPQAQRIEIKTDSQVIKRDAVPREGSMVS